MLVQPACVIQLVRLCMLKCEGMYLCLRPGPSAISPAISSRRAGFCALIMYAAAWRMLKPAVCARSAIGVQGGGTAVLGGDGGYRIAHIAVHDPGVKSHLESD